MSKLACLLALLFTSIYSHAQIGALVPSFGTGGAAITPIGTGSDMGRNLVVQTDGKIVVVGNSSNGTDLDFAVVRYNTNGTLDNTFGTGGKVTTNITPGDDDAFGVALQADGKIVVVGTVGITNSQDFGVVRYNTNGTLDLSFDGDGIVTTDITGALSDDHGSYVVIQPDAKIVVGGYRNSGSNGDFALVRYNTNGSPDPAFGGGDGIVTTDLNGGSEDFISGLLLQPDGKFVATGSSGAGGQVYDFAAVRYNTDGTLDNTFGGGTGIVTISIGGDDHCYASALQADGKILLAGWADLSGQDDFAAIRLNTNGTTDNTFNGTGIVTTNIGPGLTDDQAIGTAIQSDGKILLAGNSANGDFNLVRYLTNGALDLTFSGDGMAAADLASGQNDNARKIRLISQTIYVAGWISQGGDNNFALAAFQNDASALPLLLTQFSAQKRNDEVVLQWKTADEQNIAQFVVERSVDGKSYLSIGTLPPLNTTSFNKSYSYTDAHPSPATNYYRLLIKDADGKKQYSKILIIRLNNQHTELQLFPNPATSLLQVQLPAGMKGNVALQVIDATGKMVRTINVESAGNAIVTSFNISELKQGMYLLRVKSADQQLTTSFLKN
jgi:uncharacterized delta-60 repeat protein